MVTSAQCSPLFLWYGIHVIHGSNVSQDERRTSFRRQAKNWHDEDLDCCCSFSKVAILPYPHTWIKCRHSIIPWDCIKLVVYSIYCYLKVALAVNACLNFSLKSGLLEQKSGVLFKVALLSRLTFYFMACTI